jgi:cation:H+ antiporter
MLTQYSILEPIIWTILTMVVIWRASDGFETASEYIGRHLTDGVRGATINAIASSIPELFTTIFFLLLLRDAEGFAGGVGTTAGSAIFNGMIIPALVIITVILLAGIKSIPVSRRVIFRDGVALIVCEIALIFILSSEYLYWWHGVLLMLMYGAYVVYMLSSMRRKVSAGPDEAEADAAAEEDAEEVAQSRISALLKLDLESLVIGKRPINTKNAWTLLIVATMVIAAACAVLVFACESFGEAVGFPIYFVAVIIAAAATSVPDTIISMRDGMRGNYDDAVSNALGSNIFDICFALGLPLFLYTAFYGSIHLPIGSEVGELRLILLVLTSAALLIFILRKKMALLQALLLVGLYLLFTIYIVNKGLGSEWAMQLSGKFQHFLERLDGLF